MFYSASNGGFVPHKDYHGIDLSDAVEISEELHASLLQGQAEGKRIVPDENGYPILIDPPPSPPYVPQQVTRRQGRLALLSVGKLAEVEEMIASIEDPIMAMESQIEYEADTWERGNEFLQSMWMALGGSEEELDELFILASTK